MRIVGKVLVALASAAVLVFSGCSSPARAKGDPAPPQPSDWHYDTPVTGVSWACLGRLLLIKYDNSDDGLTSSLAVAPSDPDNFCGPR